MISLIKENPPHLFYFDSYIEHHIMNIWFESSDQICEQQIILPKGCTANMLLTLILHSVWCIILHNLVPPLWHTYHRPTSCFTGFLCSWQNILVQTIEADILLETVGHPLPPTTTFSTASLQRTHLYTNCHILQCSAMWLFTSSSIFRVWVCVSTSEIMPTGGSLSLFFSSSLSYFDMLDRRC